MSLERRSSEPAPRGHSNHDLRVNCLWHPIIQHIHQKTTIQHSLKALPSKHYRFCETLIRAGGGQTLIRSGIQPLWSFSQIPDPRWLAKPWSYRGLMIRIWFTGNF